ncbi:MAG: ATP-binding protein [Candidatus Pacearchaeota archaeon]|nr:ATP-binding protein [Candidatus Pacearchaeota archaeon]
MYNRNYYLQAIKSFINKPLIKVITGIRRCGKSYFLLSLIEILKKEKNNIIYIDKELVQFDFISNYSGLYQYVKGQLSLNKKNYLFIDEIQEIEDWERAVSSFLKEDVADIYITGSNAHLLSSELATLIAGRYVEFPIYTLNFKEFLLFHKKNTTETQFKLFLRYGGFPALYHLDLEDEIVYQYIATLFNTIQLKDIVKKNHVRNIRLLENIIKYLFDNIGNIFSAKKVSDYLKNQKLSISVDTVQNYIEYLISTYSFYRVRRYDIKGKRYLEFHEKYYCGDIGLRHAVLGYREADISGVLENIVFLALKQRGYRVAIGRLDDLEIDFIAEKQNEKIYIQVTYLLVSKETAQKEFQPLLKIADNYPKYVVSMDTDFGSDYQGIKREYLMDFLLIDRWG